MVFIQRLVPSKMRLWFAGALLLLTSAHLIVGALQYVEGKNFMLFDLLPRADYGRRASGMLGNPNHLAGFLEVVLLLGLSVSFWGRSGIGARLVAGYGAIAAAIGIIMTGSRGGWASALAGIMAFLLLGLYVFGKRIRRDLLIVALAACVVVVLALGFSLAAVYRDSNNMQTRVEGMKIDAPLRLGMWKAAVEQFKLSPIVGTGSGTYLYYGRQFRDVKTQADPTYSHNDYAQLLGEYGILGIAAALLFLGAHTWSGIKYIGRAAAERTASGTSEHKPKRSRSRSRSHSAWKAVTAEDDLRNYPQKSAFAGSNSLAFAIAALSSVAAYSVHSFVDFNLHIPANALLMAAVFGMLANPAAAPGSHANAGFVTRAIPFVTAGLAIWLAIIVLPKLPAEYYGERARRVLANYEVMDNADLARQAEQFSRKALTFDTKNPELYYDLGESLVPLAELAADPAERERLYLEAIAAYDAALNLAPMDVRLVLCKAWSLDALRRFDEAEAVFQRALELDPNSGKVHSSYADHLFQMGKLEASEERYKIAIAHGANITADYGLARVQAALKSKREGIPPPEQQPAPR
jgi:tetratricopeptide (TPR) repeat protein